MISDKYLLKEGIYDRLVICVDAKFNFDFILGIRHSVFNVVITVLYP